MVWGETGRRQTARSAPALWALAPFVPRANFLCNPEPEDRMVIRIENASLQGQSNIFLRRDFSATVLKKQDLG